jgi:hypothetical protein
MGRNRKIRESHINIFKNEIFWNIIQLSISLNVECQIRHLDKEDTNGDLEICDTINKTDKAFIDFLHRYKVSIGQIH